MSGTVTVLLTVYNRPQYLAQAIESVLAQTYEDWELLVMDDGSNGATVAALKVFALRSQNDPRVRVECFDTTEAARRLSVRYATLVNWGAAHTRGKYITYLCHDDWYFPDRLERMVAKLEQGCEVVYGPQAYADAEGTVREDYYRDASQVLHSANNRVDMNSVMHTREAFDKVGGWQDMPPSEQLWRMADGIFFDRIAAGGYSFFPVDQDSNGPIRPTDVKRYHDDSIDVKVRSKLDPWAP